MKTWSWTLLGGTYLLISSCQSVLALKPFNETLARILVAFSGAAYDCAHEDCESLLSDKYPDASINKIHDDATDANGFVGYFESQQAIVVSFAGSTSLTNWVSDLTWGWQSYSPCANCYVHEGFYATYNSIRQQILDRINYHISSHPEAPIWVTGHSLGGALAVLATADLLGKYNLSVDTLMTFGAPRVGDDDFTDYYHYVTRNMQYNYRITNSSDPVPHLPPYPFGYRHQAVEIFYRDSTNYRECDPSGEDMSCSESMVGYFDAVRDHLYYLGLDFCTNTAGSISFCF